MTHPRERRSEEVTMLAETTLRSPVVLRWRRRRGTSPVVRYASADASSGRRRSAFGARRSAGDAIGSGRATPALDQARDVRAMRVLYGV